MAHRVVQGAVRGLLLALLACVPGGAQAASPFDGTWSVVLTCPATEDGTKGYTYRFDATVENAVLHAQNSAPGITGYLVLDGTIQPDGTAMLSAHGETGDPDYAVGRVRRSTAYAYPVQARFAPGSGSGQRMTTRPCTFTFGKRR